MSNANYLVSKCLFDKLTWMIIYESGAILSSETYSTLSCLTPDSTIGPLLICIGIPNISATYIMMLAEPLWVLDKKRGFIVLYVKVPPEELRGVSLVTRSFSVE